MRRQVFPQAPSPTMTSFRRISAILHNQERRVVEFVGQERAVWEDENHCLMVERELLKYVVVWRRRS